MKRFIGTAIAICCLPTLAVAASPEVQTILPRGGQRGTEVEVTFVGQRLDDAQEAMFYDAAGITVEKLDVVDAKHVKAKLKIAPDARLGEYSARLRTKTGLSDLHTFWVGPFPATQEAEPNDDPATAQKIAAMNVTVEGVIKNEDVDSFIVTAKKGQRISAEVEGFRLGDAFFDPYLSILDAQHKELVACDDSALLLQDPVASILAPADGQYIVQVRDSSYTGGDSFHYRLHLGTFPTPRIASPLGAQPGQELSLRLLGDAAGPTTQPVKVAASRGDEMDVYASQDGVIDPTPVHLRVSPLPSVVQVEPNNTPKTATAAGGELPRAFDGVIDAPGDVDFFRFSGKKGQVFDINVYARRLRSPLDSVLVIHDAGGKRLDGNDDNGDPDSYKRFTIPADGDYLLSVRDHLHAGGEDYVYRIEVAPVTPHVTLSIPLVANNSQERQVVAVPRGNRFATMLRVTRSDFGGDLAISSPDLPAGVRLSSDTFGASPDAMPVVFEAAADAPLSGKLCNLIAKPTDARASVESSFEQAADLVVAMNNTAFYQAKVDKLAVAVVDEVPFKLSIVQPKVPIVQSGSMALKVVAERKPGFTAPIQVRLPFNPPGISSGAATIEGSATEAAIPVNASGDAPARSWKICALGSADADGRMWVSSPLADLEVSAPFVGGKIEMATVEQGEHSQVICTLEQKTPFDGKAKIKLVGLPPNASADEKEISATDTQVIFDVATSAKTPPGQHKTLFCVVSVPGAAGQTIPHNIAGGGVLRVDRPAPAPAVAKAPASQPAAPEKPLSRLEKLRLEAKQRSGT